MGYGCAGADNKEMSEEISNLRVLGFSLKVEYSHCSRIFAERLYFTSSEIECL